MNKFFYFKVNVKAVPIDQGVSGDERRLRRLSRPDEGDRIFGGHPPPPQDIPYEATVREKKDIFHAISMMKVILLNMMSVGFWNS